MLAACHGCLVVLRRLRLCFGLGGTSASPCVRNDVVRPTGHHPLHADTHRCCRYLLLLSSFMVFSSAAPQLADGTTCSRTGSPAPQPTVL